MFRKLWNFLFGVKKVEPQIKKPDVSQLRFPNHPVVPSTYRGNPTPVRSTPNKPVPQRRTTTSQLRAEPARVSSGSSYDPTLDIVSAALITAALTPDTCSHQHSEGSNNWAGDGGASGGGGASASWAESSPASSESSYSAPSYSSSDSYGSSSSSSSSSYSSDSYSSSSSYDSGSSSYSSSDSSSSSSDSSW